jgi:DDE family transposase
MTHPYSTESVQAQLDALGLPFAEHFARALVALLTARKISVHQVTQLMPGEQNPEANRQQIRRCLDHESLAQPVWARAIAALLPRTKWILALDRTEWKRGDTTVNLLVLAVVVHGCAVPVLWMVLPACGASDTTERKELLRRFVHLFGKEQIRFVTADREFIGFDWVAWLLKEEIPFRIRIKAGESLLHPGGREQKARDWFAVRACRCKPYAMQLWGLWLYVGGKHLRAKDYLIVISNRAGDLLADYRLRWKIETLFQALKGRGFDLESCRLSQERRLSGWFGFLALGLCWCLKVGHSLDQADPLPLKKHGRRAVSIFQRGLCRLQSLLSCLSGRPHRGQFQHALGALCPVK